MTAQPIHRGTPTTGTRCDRRTAVTRSLLGYGLVAGPFYLVVSLAQALTRPGFDLTRHSWSLLANGALGWIQIANLALTGLMVAAFALGVRRATGTVWAPRLLAGTGVALVCAAALRADPSDGFPVGTPAGPGPVSWHGAGHLLAAGSGFACLAGAALVLAARFAAAGRGGLAWYARVSAIVFLAGFAAVAAGGGASWSILCFTAAVVVIFTWLTVTAGYLYRHAGR